MIEMIEVRLCAPPGMVEGDPHQRCDRVAVAQRLHGRVPYYDGMEYWLVPIRIFISHRREDLVQMVDVRVANERAQDAVSVVLLEAELYVVGVEVQVGLGRGDAQDQRYLDEGVARAFHIQTGIGIALVHRQTGSHTRHESERGHPSGLIDCE